MMPLVRMVPESMIEDPNFEALVAPHLEELRATAVRLADSGEEAEELVQESLASAVAGFPRLRNRKVLGAWLLQIMRRKHFDLLRRRYRERKFQAQLRFEPVDLPDRADMELVRRALRDLKPEERRVLELKYFQQKNSKEIASIVGRSSGSVRSLIFYTLRKMEVVCRRAAGEDES